MVTASRYHVPPGAVQRHPMPAPTVSVIVLTFNRRELLRRCLESLFRQTYPAEALEIVVSDDGSTDGTGDLVRELAATRRELIYVPQPHRGIAAARNSGLRHAGGSLVAIVADDYVLREDYVETFVAFLAAHREVGPLAGGRSARMYICILPGAFAGLFLALNALRLAARLPQAMFTAGRGKIPAQLSRQPTCHWTAVSRTGTRLAGRIVMGEGDYRSSVEATLVFAEALVRGPSAEPPRSGVFGVEELLRLPDVRPALV